MAGARPQTFRLKPTPPAPSQRLLEGFKFRRWDDEVGELTARVDDTGLLLSLQFDRREGIPIYLCEVSDVRRGKYARQPKDHKVVDALIATAGVSSFEDIGLTIVHGTNMVDVNFINLAAPSAEDASQFVEDIRKLLYNTVGVNVSEQIMLYREHSRLCALNNPEKGGIAIKHIQSLFDIKGKDEFRQAMVNFGWDTRKIEHIPCAEFTRDKFLQLYDRLVPTPYVDTVFSRILSAKSRKPYATAVEFRKFLNLCHRDQRLNEILFKYLKDDEVQQIIAVMEPKKDYADKFQLTMNGLLTFLRSKENAIIHLSRFAVHQDLERPLCHYYINSSHNTYLTGHQLTGKATVEIYRQVLLTGCRCIELDCWDGADGEPIITHGNTLVNNIPFVDVVEAINECAFTVTDLPVILSFENHCRFKQQRRMVQYLRAIFGDKLILEPLEDFPVVPDSPLPPPSRLRGKVVCKNKLLVPSQKGKDEDGSTGTLPRRAVLERDDTVASASAPVSPRRIVPLDGDDASSTTSSLKSPVESVATVTSPADDLPTITMTTATEQNDDVDAATARSSTSSTSDPDAGAARSSSPTKPTDVGRRSTSPPRTSPTTANGVPGGQTTAKDSASSDSSCLTSPTGSDKTVAGSGGASADATIAESSEPANAAASAATGGSGSNALPADTLLPATTGWSDLDMPSLVNYAEPIKFRSFAESEENNKHYQMSSFNETTGVRLVLDFPKDYLKYTQRQNTRIYPKGTRVDSSNYQPQVFWNVGCQMVSLNFQTLDLPMQLNLGKFDYNGMCGYLLKPEVMRRSDRDFDPFAESPIDNVVAATMKVQVLAGHMISNAKETIRVEVDMYGIPADTVRRKFKTKYVQNDITISFNTPPFEFKKVILPDLAMLRLAVIDSQGTLLGMRVLPLDGLEPGYRYVHLNNERNQSLPLASLFVNIEVSEYIPEDMEDFALGLMDPIRYQRERHQAALRAMTDDDLMDAGNPTDPGARRPSDGPLPGLLAPRSSGAGPNAHQIASKRPSLPPSMEYGAGARKPAGVDAMPRMSIAVAPAPAPLQPAAPNRPRLSLHPSTVTTGRDILGSKEASKALGKMNKELSAIRKKFLKTHASLMKAQATELKKRSGKGDSAAAGAMLRTSHADALSQLVRSSVQDEEATLLKLLPAFFAYVAKTMASRHTGEIKLFEERFKREVAAMTTGIQKDNAQLSQSYKLEQKRKVADKEELERKIREYRNKLVESAVGVRQEAERTKIGELDALGKAHQNAMADLKAAEDLEAERVKKVYATRLSECSEPAGLEMYITIALEDHSVAILSLSQLP